MAASLSVLRHFDLLPARVSVLPGLVVFEGERCVQTFAFELGEGRVVAIYIVRNPDKLERVRV